MENNKILIGVQFNDEGGNIVTTIELYVLRDIMLKQLLEGIEYGVLKLKNKYSESTTDSESEMKRILEKCHQIIKECQAKTQKDRSGDYYSNIIVTSLNDAVAEKYVHNDGKHFTYYVKDKEAPICELGFITSTRIVFDISGRFELEGGLKDYSIVAAFDPGRSKNIVFPEYNISSRQLQEFDKEPVEIIPPTDPPKKPNANIFNMLLPSLLSMGVMIIVRIVLASGESTGSGAAMIALSIAMGATAVITTILNFKRQHKEYKKSLKNWREQYQAYIDNTVSKIVKRQNDDVIMLDKLYPDMLSLINRDNNGFQLNDSLYSRSSEDKDFLTVRLGISDDVENFFEIKGESKEVVFSEAFFKFVPREKNQKNSKQTGEQDIKQSKLEISLRNELKASEADKVGEAGESTKYDNLCHLPSYISKQLHKMERSPFLYCLKNKGALGIVDYDLDKYDTDKYNSNGQYIILRMIFELCYYHSPEDLQFIVFFKQKEDLKAIDREISFFKFMPHFRGLFPDMSQFVFDNDSANYVLSNLLNIVSTRRDATEENKNSSGPHIVLIVFDEHGLKEHAFAEYLPKAPETGKEYVNDIGLTFVYAVKYKEYLPAYCNDIIEVNGKNMSVIPHEDRQKTQVFEAPKEKDFARSIRKIEDTFTFISSIYYAQIAQNGKVPSSVSSFRLYDINKSDDVEKMIRNNWGMDGARDKEIDVTRTLKVPVGKKNEKDKAYLDLHERADGPHMLVAGTTGSGKSEAIINYLLGLCAVYRPDELNLLLVDMKGGGFTKRIGDLPHVVGTVTDVDGDENGTSPEYMLRRFLDAMTAEIKLRKILFNKMHVDSIDDYIAACREIKPDGGVAYIKKKGITNEKEKQSIIETAKKNPLSHLILVVDEFTELKRFSSENNDIDFIGEITTIARVGRSLGFHIILISQNIEGAITDDIRVNSRARLCLKVATKQASKEMIGTEVAASPSMPGNGRAYLQVGTGSRLEYFQSGYSGAITDEEIPVEFTLASKNGKNSSFYNSAKDNRVILDEHKKKEEKGQLKKQLEVWVKAIKKVYETSDMNSMHEEERIPRLVFRPPLPAKIALGSDNNYVEVGKK